MTPEREAQLREMFEESRGKREGFNPKYLIRNSFGSSARADARPVCKRIANGTAADWWWHRDDVPVGTELFTHPEASAPGLSDEQILSALEKGGVKLQSVWNYRLNADVVCTRGSIDSHKLVAGVRAVLALTRASAATESPDARTEELRKGLFEARDAMRVMSNWVKQSDPAGHSWGVRMVDRANAVLSGASAATVAEPVIDPSECAQDVYKDGQSIGLFDIQKDTANAICAGISAATGTRVDWHYIAGRVHIKALKGTTVAEPSDSLKDSRAAVYEASQKLRSLAADLPDAWLRTEFVGIADQIANLCQIPDAQQQAEPKRCNCAHVGECDGSCAPYVGQQAEPSDTPQLHVGDSSFEGWYQGYAARLTGNPKQTARDAYAAGMSDPLVMPREASQQHAESRKFEVSEEWLSKRLAIADDADCAAGQPKQKRPCDSPPGCNGNNCLGCGEQQAEPGADPTCLVSRLRMHADDKRNSAFSRCAMSEAADVLAGLLKAEPGADERDDCPELPTPFISVWADSDAEDCRLDVCYTPSAPRRDGTYATKLYTAEQMRAYARAAQSGQRAGERECRHCGWMCRPNDAPTKKWHPLEQEGQRAGVPTYRCSNVHVKSLSDGNVMVTMLAKAFEPAAEYDVQPVNPAAVRSAPTQQQEGGS